MLHAVRNAILGAAALVAGWSPTQAQEFPQPGRPLMLVTGFPAGTAPDI